VPGLNDSGIKHDGSVPSEVMFHGHAVCWVKARPQKQPGSVPRRSRSTTSPSS
jgi:hypothetical protein